MRGGYSLINFKVKWSKKYNQLIFLMIIALAFAVLAEFISEISLDYIHIIKDNKEKKHEWKIDDFQGYDININQDILVSQTNDAVLINNNIQGTVRMAILNLQKCKGYNWTLQTYWEMVGDSFAEEKSLKQWVFGNQTSIIIPIIQTADGFCIKLGNEKGEVWEIENLITNPTLFDYYHSVLSNISIPKVAVYFFVLAFLGAAHVFKGQYKRILFQYRWIWGCILLIVCVVLKLHGSSIGVLFVNQDSSLLWGIPREIRSDEYAIFTEMALSQVKTGFKWFSDVWGYSSSDMFMVYGQPVSNLVTLYRPFSVGYIIFGAEYGLSFYWCSRLIVCFLTSFEFGRLLTKDDKKLALAYAFIISFSPIVQWWFSINELVEMLIFGQLIIVLLYKYFVTDSLKKKIVSMMGIVLCIGGYVLALYPAWMIPLFYVFLAATVAMIIENRKIIKIQKQDILVFCFGLIILLVSFVYIYNQSKQTINAVMNTVYPGSRRINGGDISLFSYLFRGWTGNVWSFLNIGNPCEAVTFYDLFPLGIILSGIILFRKKGKDIWLISLNVSNCILLLYVLFQFPSIIANISFLGLSSPQRVFVGIGLINLIILVRALASEDVKKWSIFAAVVFSVIICFISLTIETNLDVNMKAILVAFSALIVSGLMACDQRERAKRFLVLAIIISILGGQINPVSSGLSSIYENPLIQHIEKINNEEEGLWAVSGSTRWNNFPTIVGAKTINALQTYPDVDLWNKLGVSEQEDLWNRYAYLTIEIIDEGDTYLTDMGSADSIMIHTTLEDLHRIGVTYLLTTSDLGMKKTVRLLYGTNGWRIYKLDMDEMDLAEADSSDSYIAIDYNPDEKEMNISAGSFVDYDTVSFALWSDENGQDDLAWYKAKKTDGGNWQCTVDISKHGEGKLFIIHAYGYCGGETGNVFSYAYQDITNIQE